MTPLLELSPARFFTRQKHQRTLIPQRFEAVLKLWKNVVQFSCINMPEMGGFVWAGGQNSLSLRINFYGQKQAVFAGLPGSLAVGFAPGLLSRIIYIWIQKTKFYRFPQRLQQ
jgi:hypothetical protein